MLTSFGFAIYLESDFSEDVSSHLCPSGVELLDFIVFGLSHLSREQGSHLSRLFKDENHQEQPEHEPKCACVP